MKITSSLFHAHVNCPTKCWLRFTGEPATGNAYAEWAQGQNESYRDAAIKRFRSEGPQDECAVAPAQEDLQTSKWRLGFDVVATFQNLETRLHAVERVPPEGRGKSARFLAIRFVFTNKLGKDEKLLLAFDALVLTGILRREVSLGKIIRGDHQAAQKVKTVALAGEVRKRIEKIAALLSSQSPPDLILNRHCTECEFQARCRQKAMEKDDLSLLAGMNEKDRKKHHSKGIFTITQLSCTFRPRRRPRRLRDKREKYHHSLKALAIRERKIHIIGSPELKIEGTPVYLDVEGLPDRDFYYLIGMRIGTGESAVQHSLWADSLQDEKHIWNAFLSILERIANPVLIHYGSYEKTFLKQMIERHGQPKEEAVRDNIIGSSVNVLSVTFAQIYFPAFTNGLKDTAHCLGFNWTDARAGGLQAIAWRYLWEQSRAAELKERLIRYNTQDCQALSLVADLISKYTGPQENGAANENGRAEVVHADADKFLKRSKWRTFASPVSGFEYINSAAHWCYQRDRVYARTGAAKRQLPTHKRRVQMSRRVEKEVRWEVSHFCPVCKRRVWKKGPLRTRTLQDILFGRNSLKLRIVRFAFQTYHCPKCRNCFGMPARFQLCRKYGWTFLAYFFYHIVELAMPQRAVAKSFNRLFGFHLNCSTLNNLKIKAADYYTETKQQILERIIRGPLVHADETRANIKGRSAFVWVLASMSEVFYILSDSREGEIAQKLLTEFKGVLVSDFYTAYDSIGCPQQRCLIHLMRDLNDEILNNPFDDQLKAIVTGFGDLLKPIVETVDRFGLKSHFLKKHLVCVERFYRRMERAECSSDAALKCKERFERNRGKLFTFLEYDGVPWNNNNAEHAIKAFARLRDVIAGSSTETGVEEYLTLLSICKTCEYMGVDFLDFLRSGEKDIHAFAESRGGRRRRPSATPLCELPVESHSENRGKPQ